MPFKRKRPAESEKPKQIIVYQFWARPIGELPQTLFDGERERQWLWNELVRRRKMISEETKEMEKDAKKERWRAFDAEVRSFLKSEGVTSRLHWQDKEQVVISYEAAVQRILKNGGHLREQKGMNRLLVRRRFTGGGREINRFFKSEPKPLAIRRTKEEVYRDNRRESRRGRYTRASFKLNEAETLHFEVILHRELPSDAIVKIAALRGERHRSFGWQWKLNLTCEIPQAVERQRTYRAVALNVGWRKMGDYLRVGMLADTEGREIELRLPIEGTETARTRWLDLPGTRAELILLQKEIDELKDQAKSKLSALEKEGLPEECQQMLSGLQKFGRRALIKFKELLPEGDETRALLENWHAENDRLQRKFNIGMERLTRRKIWLYENIAQWLTRHYDTILWEKDFSLKGIAEADMKDEPALKRGMKYRQWAGVSILRGAIKRACAKTGARLIEVDGAYRTTTCVICGSQADSTVQRLITCKQGHTIDQDVQAARNILKELPQTVELKRGNDDLAIPEQLVEAVSILHRRAPIT
jgi:hypothetical protein